MTETPKLPGLVIPDDFQDTGTLTLPEGAVVVMLIPDLVDGTYRAGSVARTPKGDYDRRYMDFMYTLGLGLLVYGTDHVEDVLTAASSEELTNLAVINENGEATPLIQDRNDPNSTDDVSPVTSTCDLGTCDLSKMGKA